MIVRSATSGVNSSKVLSPPLTIIGVCSCATLCICLSLTWLPTSTTHFRRNLTIYSAHFGLLQGRAEETTVYIVPVHGPDPEGSPHLIKIAHTCHPKVTVRLMRLAS